MPTMLLFILIFSAVAVALAKSQTTTSNYTVMVLQDSFSNTELNHTMWQVVDVNMDPDTYIHSRVEIKAGRLSLNAQRRTGGDSFTLGSVRSQQKFLYGNFTWRARAAPGAGIMSALRLFSHDSLVQQNNTSSIDIIIRGPGKSFVVVASRCIKGERLPYAHGTGWDLSTSFVTFTLLWEPRRIVVYMDGYEVDNITQSDAVPQEPMHVGMRIMVARDGSEPVDQTTKWSTSDFSIRRVTVLASAPLGTYTEKGHSAQSSATNNGRAVVTACGILSVLVLRLV